jgi:UDP-N-acetylmuramate dehydrogenase
MANYLALLQSIFGERLKTNVPLARYTAARIGGVADALLVVKDTEELAEAVCRVWEAGIPYMVLGGGSNVLISDFGVRKLVILNHAKKIVFQEAARQPSVWAESGAGTGMIARQAAAKGLGGLEWAAGIPGTIGGAVVGNAGAHGGDVAGCLVMAEILQRNGNRQNWAAKDLGFTYRSSRLKQEPGNAVVLAVTLALEPKPVKDIEARLQEYLDFRRRTQPPGASMGSMFKNPPGDYAGKLIEAAGLKGLCVGDAEISQLHANFFINRGQASARDVKKLIDTARSTVEEKFGIRLELEIELIGEWDFERQD